MSEFGALSIILVLTVAAMAAIALTVARIIARRSPRSLRNRELRPMNAELLPPCRFDRALDQAVSQAKRHGTFLSLIRVEIDDFQGVRGIVPNPPDDPSGAHAGGADRRARFHLDIHERVLAFIQATIPGTGVITCMPDGGFAIVVPGSDESAALKLTDILRRGTRLETHGVPTRPAASEHRITCCFGVASLERHDTVNTFRDRAENALRHAQRHGTNRIMGQTAAEATAVNS